MEIRKNEANDHLLILKDIQKDEEAEYACRAVNIAGEAWCFSDVVVRSSKGPCLICYQSICWSVVNLCSTKCTKIAFID